ncbi:MAG: F0F1 ATP synthase subunit A [Actinomycetota bacterium]|nr:F0F1 ATP synthase subunit A [Actinomycetota bacterium]
MPSLLSALHFPPIKELVDWRPILFEGTLLEVNKVVILMWLAVALTLLVFFMAGRRAKVSLVPSGVQNVVESGVEFIRKDVVLQTIGPDGMGWMPFLITLFFFIFFGNLFDVLPFLQFPVNARMALPAFMALLVWAIFNVVGMKAQGVGGYFKSMLVPPGVPKFLLPLVALIEFVSTIFVRPFSLAVRLFANMLAGYLLLITFEVLCAALWTKSIMAVILPLPFAMLVALMGFEILVAVLQAFIFTILTAVYIGGAMHPEH